MWNKAEKALSQDKIIGPLIKKYGKCKIAPRHHKSYFIDLAEAIVSQQLSIKAADTIFGRVEKKVKKLTPENILKTSDEELRECGLSWAKVSYIKDLAQKVLDKKLKVTKLGKMSNEEVERELIAVKGIGKWTAEMFLMFTLGRPDIFPVEDLGIRNGMKKLIDLKMTEAQMVEYAQKWSPYRTIASWYIWRSLDNTPK